MLIRADNAITPLRLGLALLVVFSHAFDVGGFGPDPLERVTGGQMKVGTVAVIAFFGLSGFLDFRTLEYGGGTTFDVLSLGSQNGTDLQQGLAFSGLGITMTFDVPDDVTQPFSKPAYAPDMSLIAFDPVRSTRRDGSLASSLALKVDSLITGVKATPPSALGYVDVATPLQLSGVSRDWYGLRLQVDFGTPGALAGAVGLTSYLLLSWSPPTADGAATQIGCGLRLPGAGQGGSVLSLQGVMKLSIGPVALTQVPAADGKGQAFMLVLSEIALQFLGFLKLPPNGAVAFYLFGDTSGAGGPLGWTAIYKGQYPPSAKPQVTA